MKVKPGMVFVSRHPKTRTPSRRVLAVVKKKSEGPTATRICYSDGRQTRWCDTAAFQIWLRTRDAILTRTRRPRTMVLR